MEVVNRGCEPDDDSTVDCDHDVVPSVREERRRPAFGSVFNMGQDFQSVRRILVSSLTDHVGDGIKLLILQGDADWPQKVGSSRVHIGPNFDRNRFARVLAAAYLHLQ